MKGIMLQGTASDVGKSILTTAFCRIFNNLGYRVAPFKSQNMSNKVYALEGGKEIGLAQGIQAEAARIPPTVHMNPILLKPTGDLHSDIFCLGEYLARKSGRAYREEFYHKGLEAIQASLEILEKEYDLVIIEGAGSPVEVNLNDRELVNMKVAELADVPVLIIADIERGGVFASIIGTLALLKEEERERVQGIIINKFRGDLALFAEGVTFIEEQTGKKVVGVIPYLDGIDIEPEDSLSDRELKRRGEVEGMHGPQDEFADPYEVLAGHVNRYLDFDYILHVVEDWHGS